MMSKSCSYLLEETGFKPSRPGPQKNISAPGIWGSALRVLHVGWLPSKVISLCPLTPLLCQTKASASGWFWELTSVATKDRDVKRRKWRPQCPLFFFSCHLHVLEFHQKKNRKPSAPNCPKQQHAHTRHAWIAISFTLAPSMPLCMRKGPYT